ncbi:hypothetical protein UACE39S_03376 [Ureibacillus acetophenoni]
MSKEQFQGLFFLWVIVIGIELFWLYMTVTSYIYDAGFIAFVITFIASTLIIGAFGIYLVSKHVNWQQNE